MACERWRRTKSGGGVLMLYQGARWVVPSRGRLAGSRRRTGLVRSRRGRHYARAPDTTRRDPSRSRHSPLARAVQCLL